MDCHDITKHGLHFLSTCFVFYDLVKDIQAKIHLYADDIVIYAHAPSTLQAEQQLQTACQSLQTLLLSLKVVLNNQKIKFMVFSKARSQLHDECSIFKSDGEGRHHTSTTLSSFHLMYILSI